MLALAATLLIVAALACALPTPAPTAQPTAPAETSTAQPTAAPTEIPTAQPTAPPTAIPTAVLTSLPTATAPPASTPIPTATAIPPSGLAILTFTVSAEDLPPAGKRLTFRWQTTGATRAGIWSGTQKRFPPFWIATPPDDGTLTVELQSTIYRDPQMMLVAYDAGGNSVSASVTVPWDCQYDYFFPADLSYCPHEANTTWAAEQPFEHGRMIWLEQISAGSSMLNGVILVLYEDHGFRQYRDTWTEGMPESDPAIVPPAGLYQPIRGFGKLWREETGVRDGLGWATAPEQGFNSTWQTQILETHGGFAFVRRLDGKIVRLAAWDAGGSSWEIVTP